MRSVLLSTASAVSLLAVLGGTAHADLFTTSLLSWDFGYVLAGTTSGAKTVTVSRSDGAGTVNGNFTATGPFISGSQIFTLNNPKPSASDSVQFAPTALGSATGTLTVTGTSASSKTTDTVSLSGTGVGAKAGITTPDTIDILVGKTKTLSLGIANNGNTTAATGFGNYALTGTAGAVSSGPITGSGGNINLTRGQSTSFAYTGAPTARGVSTTNVTVKLDNGNPNGSNSAVTLSEPLTIQGVAPVNSVSVTNAPTTRIGTSSTAKVTITNVGDGTLAGGTDSAANPIYLRGSVGQASPNTNFALAGAASVTVDLSDKAGQNQQIVSYTYTPTAHRTDSASVSASFTNGSTDGKNQAQTVPVTLQGTGVGPTYSSATVAPGGTIDFGQVRTGTTATYDLRIANTSTDFALDKTLTELSLLSQSLSGAGVFHFGTNLTGTVLDEGGFFDLLLDFTPVTSGLDIATLTIGTDQGAAFKALGQSFTYTLKGTAVPEPASFAVLGSGLVGLGLLRRRHATRHPA
jgi:PEP-CTERM motif